MRLKKDRLKDEARRRNLSQSGTKAKLVKRIIGGSEASLKTVKKNVGPLERVCTRSQAAASKYFNIFFRKIHTTYCLLLLIL